MNDNLWIGTYADKKAEKVLINSGIFCSHDINVQRKLMEGLEENGYLFDSINMYVDLPKQRKLKRIFFNIDSRHIGVIDQAIPFVNIRHINRIEKTIRLIKAVKAWCEESQGKNVVMYSVTSYFLLAGLYLKRKYGVNTIVIIPDLPEYMRNSKNFIYRLLKRIDRVIIDYSLKRLDSMIFFSEHMRERLPVENKPYYVVEGVLNIDEEKYMDLVESRYKNDDKIVMLTGHLDLEEGIEDLLEAFSCIDGDEYKLWISGTGSGEQIIKQYCEKDKRITYYGYIDSYEEFLNTQRKAKVFVVMVRPTNPKSPYYFPSKIMEYMATGGIVACHKLKCIPSEYNNYLNYFEEGNISNTIKRLLDLDKSVVKEEGIKRIVFLKEKNSKNTAKKIIRLMK